jgi:hypothetical protein
MPDYCFDRPEPREPLGGGWGLRSMMSVRRWLADPWLLALSADEDQSE